MAACSDVRGAAARDREGMQSDLAMVGGGTMETTATVAGHEAIDYEDLLVHEWRATQLKRLGVPVPLAEAVADHVDWHQVAGLVRRGCPPRLALRIAR
jgi:hypothetical protein